MLLAALLLAPPDLSPYRTWACVTPQAVDMAPAIAISCVGPASWDSSKDNPHAPKRFKVWVNPAGRSTMSKPLWKDNRKLPSRFPEGTVIVKEKFDASSDGERMFDPKRKVRPLPDEPELLTVMVKLRKGAKPKTGDWSYYVADGKGKKVDASQEARCASCHAARPEYDYTFRGYGGLTH